MSTQNTGADTEVSVDQLHDWLLSSDALDDFLREIATHVVGEIADGLSCGITVHTSQRRPYTIGSSDGLAQQLDEAQYKADEGPCLQALREGVTVDVPDLADQVRWPNFHREALAIGLSASLSIPMISRGDPVGALNLYGRATGGLTRAEKERAQRFADRASGAIALAARTAEQHNIIEDLQAALTSRTAIDQALGIIMAQQGCTAEHAFALLRQNSQHRNIKLRDLAAELITEVSGEPPRPGPRVT